MRRYTIRHKLITAGKIAAIALLALVIIMIETF
jgi:hypothetical protein